MSHDLKADAERKRILARVREQEKRTGAKLIGKAAPKPVKRGVFRKDKGASGVTKRKGTAVINVMSGRDTKRTVKRVVQ